MNFNNLPDKETYFTEDVINFVASEMGMKPHDVKMIMKSYQKSLNRFIMEDDAVMINVPQLGILNIRLKTLKTKVHGDSTDVVERFSGLTNAVRLENYKLKEKKLLNTYLHYKHNKRSTREYKSHWYNMYYRLVEKPTHKLQPKRLKMTLTEYVKEQNEYAYEHFRNNNLNPSLLWERLVK